MGKSDNATMSSVQVTDTNTGYIYNAVRTPDEIWKDIKETITQSHLKLSQAVIDRVREIFFDGFKTTSSIEDFPAAECDPQSPDFEKARLEAVLGRKAQCTATTRRTDTHPYGMPGNCDIAFYYHYTLSDFPKLFPAADMSKYGSSWSEEQTGSTPRAENPCKSFSYRHYLQASKNAMPKAFISRVEKKKDVLSPNKSRKQQYIYSLPSPQDSGENLNKKVWVTPSLVDLRNSILVTKPTPAPHELEDSFCRNSDYNDFKFELTTGVP